MALLDHADNVFGPLTPAVRGRVAAYLVNPTPEGWDAIHGVLIRTEGMVTLWKAVCRVDPTFPRRKVGSAWERVPDAILLARAIRTALAG